jgi:hypothetical protein
MRRQALSLPALVLALALAHTPGAHAVLRFDTTEVVLRADRSYNGLSGTPNPFTDVTLTARVTSPAGRVFNVEGFFDGDGLGGATGNVFKVRVYTDEIGTWTWRTASNNLGLHAKAGTISCSGTLGGAFGKGPIVENSSNPRSFKYQYGEPVYLIGKFLDFAAPDPLKFSHTMFSEKLTGPNRQAMLDRHAGMKLNKMNVYLANRGDYSSVSTTPWVGTAAANDKQRFDLQRWQMFERWVVNLRNAGMAAHLWFFADDSGFGDLPDEDRKLLIRYAMARLSGYANTLFTLVLEWQEGWTDTEVDTHAKRVQLSNPWDRLVSVMGTPGDFAFPDAGWADYLQIQVGFVGHDKIHAEGVQNRALAAKPLIVEEFSHGEEITANRQAAWAAFTSGAAGSGTGAFLQHLSRFAARVDFERMSPADALVLSGAAYGLAEANRAYVFYLHSGGTVSVNLGGAAGPLIVEWYNPRTGAFTAAPATTGGAARSFTAPTAEDWVLYIHK